MEWPPGFELDRHIARLLQGNDVLSPPRYSTSPVASRRLLALLSKTLGLAALVEHDGALFYCRLTRGGATVATGSAATTELAAARAAANLSVAILGAPSPAPSAERAARFPRPRRAPRPSTVPCDLCGAPMKPPPAVSARRLCNPCSYRALMAAARERSGSPGPSGGPRSSAG